MKKRLFLESDNLREDEFETSKFQVANILEEMKIPFCEEVFDTVIDFAWHKLADVLKAIKETDEIYADSSLMPLVGNNYMGAPVIMNEMMKAAIEQHITGKSLFFLRAKNDMYWYLIDIKLLPKAFKKNDLYFYDYTTNRFEKTDIKALMNTLKKSK